VVVNASLPKNLPVELLNGGDGANSAPESAR